MKFSQMTNVFPVFAAVLLLAACTTVPSQTFDGLELVPGSGFAAVYKRPHADLSAYQAYGLSNCEVAFRKNWLRSQNSSSMDLANRVTQQDVDRIRDRLGKECDKYFREALEQAPPYPLVDSFDDGEAVLVLRPSIIDLDIVAPAKNTAGMQRTYTTESGEMTLLLELVDGTTGEILVRVIDRQRARDRGYLQWTNSVTNQADARRVLTRWSKQLRAGLDEATTGERTTE